jgi:ATP-dependent Clp protease adapter protein ClpS
MRANALLLLMGALSGVASSSVVPEATVLLRNNDVTYDVVLAALRSVLFLSASEAAEAAAEAHRDGMSAVLAASESLCVSAAAELVEYGLSIQVRRTQQLTAAEHTAALQGWGAVLVHNDEQLSEESARRAFDELGLSKQQIDAVIEDIEAEGAGVAVRATLEVCAAVREQLTRAGLKADVRADIRKYKLAGMLGLDAL